jgi:serine/threonine protein kinase
MVTTLERNNDQLLILENGKEIRSSLPVEVSKRLDMIRIWMNQVLLGLEFIHSQGYVHGDLKPQSLIISEDGDAKIIDFGSSVFIKDTTTSLRIQFTTPYLAIGKFNYVSNDSRSCR